MLSLTKLFMMRISSCNSEVTGVTLLLFASAGLLSSEEATLGVIGEATVADEVELSLEFGGAVE